MSLPLCLTSIPPSTFPRHFLSDTARLHIGPYSEAAGSRLLAHYVSLGLSFLLASHGCYDLEATRAMLRNLHEGLRLPFEVEVATLAFWYDPQRCELRQQLR